MSQLESRREFLKKSSMFLGSAAVLGLTGCAAAESSSTAPESSSESTTEVSKEVEIPKYPFTYVELDPERAAEDGFAGYNEYNCCYGVAKAILVQLQEKVGYPYTAYFPEMFVNGGGGYGVGTICGALGGAVAMIGLVCGPEDTHKVTAELFKWYTSTPIPSYKVDIELPSTVSPSVNCADSVSTFLKKAEVENGDPVQLKRCGALTADVAKKTVELLNVHFGFAEAAPVEETDTEETLAENEYIGEAESYGGTVKVKVTMDGDKISKIDVLSHSDTAGICDAAYETIPEAIISAQSTEVDTVANATISSKAIMAAVEDALSKVGK